MNKCYLCNQILEHEYRVKIIDTSNGHGEFVSCCSMECAEMLKENNADIHKFRYEDVKKCSIQRLK